MIKENKLNIGDRVASTINGYYAGQPGTVIRESESSKSGFVNQIKEYDIELDTGEIITLGTNKLKIVEDDVIEEETVEEEVNNE